MAHFVLTFLNVCKNVLISKLVFFILKIKIKKNPKTISPRLACKCALMWWSIYRRGVASSTSIKEADRLVSLLPSLKTAEGWQRCARSLSGNMMNNLSLCQWPIFVCHSRLCEQDSSRAEVTAPCRKSVHSAYEVALNFCNYMYIVKCIYEFTHVIWKHHGFPDIW